MKYILISILFSLLFSIVVYPILKKNNRQTISIYLSERHSSKHNTPTMGGILFVIPPIIIITILLLLKVINITYNLFIVLFTYFSFFIIGIIDDLLIVKKRDNKGLSENSKLFLQIIISTIIFYLFLKGGNEPLIWIHTLNIKLNIGFLYGFFILLILTSSSNATNITDGLDGLTGGLSIFCLVAFLFIINSSGFLEGYQEIAIFVDLVLGSLIVFILYNSYPAKIFMGDAGSLSIGALIGILAILTRRELLLILVAGVFVIETITCIIQRFYYKLTKRRIFPITPIHHTFENILPEYEVVKYFYLLGIVFMLLGIIFGVNI